MLLAVPAAVPLIAAGALLAGVGLMAFDALWGAALQERVPPESLARVSAYDWLGSLALNPLGAALVGPVAAAIAIRATLLGCAAVVTVVNLWVLGRPGVRRTTTVEAMAPEPARAPT